MIRAGNCLGDSVTLLNDAAMHINKEHGAVWCCLAPSGRKLISFARMNSLPGLALLRR